MRRCWDGVGTYHHVVENKQGEPQSTMKVNIHNVPVQTLAEFWALKDSKKKVSLSSSTVKARYVIPVRRIIVNSRTFGNFWSAATYF